MKNYFLEMYDDIEQAIDYAFKGKFILKLYDYLKVKNIKKRDVEILLQSSIIDEINNLIEDMEDYLEGGNDDIHKQLREGYGYIPKPQARKIKNYLHTIIEDARRYVYDKRPGRRKKQSK